jgi:hypothetical protein
MENGFDVQPEIAVAAIAGAAHKLGQPLLPVTADVAEQILRIAANGSGPSSNNTYLFDGLPWWLRWPLQMIGGAICGGATFVAVALLYLIATFEWLGFFCDDVGNWIGTETVEAAVDEGVVVRAPLLGGNARGIAYHGAADPAGGKIVSRPAWRIEMRTATLCRIA